MRQTSDFSKTGPGRVCPCFASGTMIATANGDRLIDDLRPGDRIVTRDNGVQEIRWIGARDLGWKDLQLAPHLRPIVLRRGALDGGGPDRDLYVSPDHRVLASDRDVMFAVGGDEVLAPAKHLIDHRLVRPLEPLRVRYVHLLFDRHEVIRSNGLWSESFRPDVATLNGMGNAQRLEVLTLFPDLAKGADSGPARPARRLA